MVKLEAALELKVIAPAEELPILIAPVELPVFILVAKLEEAFMLTVLPEIDAPALPVRSPALVIVPEPVVKIFPDVEMLSPEVAGWIVVPDLLHQP